MAAIRFRSGSDFGAVYERHHKALYRYCRSILHNEEDAQDALQSTMTRALAALQVEERDLELRPWLFRIAHNEAITILRRRRPTDELEDAPAVHSVEDRVLEREELRALALDLADLPERQRAALILRELNGLSHAEIGDVLGLSVSAVKTAIFEARTAVSNCREGRELACTEIRRALSDGDGRVLRGRGIRAHLRSCRDCRCFRDELGRRPRTLAALLPGGALFAQLFGGTAAKVVVCAVVAGVGTTLAVETRDARGPAAAAAATPVATAKPHRAKPKPVRALRTPAPVVVSTPQRAAPARTVAAVPAHHAKRVRHHRKHPARPHAAKVTPAATAAAPPAPAPAPAPVVSTLPPGLAKKVAKAKPTPTEKVKKVAPAKAPPPGQAKKQAAKPVPPGQAKKQDAAAPKPVPPGQAKKQDTDAAKPVPPGQAKKQDTDAAKPVPPARTRRTRRTSRLARWRSSAPARTRRVQGRRSGSPARSGSIRSQTARTCGC